MARIEKTLTFIPQSNGASETKSPSPVPTLKPEDPRSDGVRILAEKNNARLIRMESGIYEYQLSNGLKVILIPDKESEKLHGSLIIKSGSLEDPKGKTGIAHLFEHLASNQDSTNFKDGEFQEFAFLTAGYDNATTSEISTKYDWVLQSEHFDFGLERFQRILSANNVFDEESVEDEIHIVRNEIASEREIKEGDETSLNSSFWGDFNDPRNIPPGGLLSDLSSITAQDLESFGTKHYRPDNATLVLAGDFKNNKALQEITDRFAGIPNPEEELKKKELPSFGKQKRPLTRSVQHHFEDGLKLRYQIPGNLNGDKSALETLALFIKDKLNNHFENPFSHFITDSDVHVSDFGNSGEFSIDLSFIPSEEDSKVDKKAVRKYVIGIIKNIVRKGLEENDQRFLAHVEKLYLDNIKKDNVAKFGFVSNNESQLTDWHVNLERQKTKELNIEAMQEVARKFLTEQNCTTVYYIQKPLRLSAEEINDPLELEEIPKIEAEDIELTAPSALKLETNLSLMKAKAKPTLFQTKSFKLLFAPSTNETARLVLMKDGGQRLSPSSQSCLADLTTIFLKKLLQYDKGRRVTLSGERINDGQKLSLADELRELNVSVKFDSGEEDFHSLILEAPKEKKENLEFVLENIVSGNYINHLDPKSLEAILKASKTELISIYNEYYADAGLSAEVEFRKSIFDNAGKLTDKDLPEIQKELSEIKVDDIHGFFQRSFGLKNGSLVLTGPYQRGEIHRFRPVFSEWLKFPEQDKLEPIEFAAPEGTKRDELHVQNRDTVTTLMGKSWNKPKLDAQTAKVLKIVNFLAQEKLTKALRKSLAELYDVDLSINTLRSSNLGYTKVEFEAEEDRQELLEEVVNQVFQIIHDEGFSDEEIALAKLRNLYQEKDQRTDKDNVPVRYLGSVETDFEDLKNSVASIKASDINKFARTALNPDNLRVVIAA